jgi:hypothetical protein
MRMIPIAVRTILPIGTHGNARRVVLRVFRAVATAWAVAAYPGRRRELQHVAKAALYGLGSLSAPPLVRAAAYASAAATGEPDAVSRSATAASYAVAEARSNSPEALRSLLNALAVDADLLGQRFDPVTIANSKLWPAPVPPEWVRSRWGSLKGRLLATNEAWEVWTNWYEKKLAGESADQNAEIARVTVDNPLWESGPSVLNPHIQELLEERDIFQHALAAEPEDRPNIEAIPRQTAVATQFAVDAAGRIDLLADEPSPDGMQRELFQEVRYKALALSELGHNQVGEIYEPIARFLAAAPEHLEEASITRLWSRGNTLRRRLKAHDTAIVLREPDPALLSPSVTEGLRDLVESYNVFIVGDPIGRELDRVRLGPQERDDAEAAVELAASIAEAVQTSEGLATNAAIEALTEQVAAARGAPATVDGDQAIDLSQRTAGNFVVELLRLGLTRVLAEPGLAWKEYRAGVYRGLGTITAAGIVGLPVIKFIASNAQLLESFAERTFHSPALLQIIDVISKMAAGP